MCIDGTDRERANPSRPMTMSSRRSRKLVVFTGAGMSAPSGVPTFRDPEGIWSRYLVDLDLRTVPHGFTPLEGSVDPVLPPLVERLSRQA